MGKQEGRRWTFVVVLVIIMIGIAMVWCWRSEPWKWARREQREVRLISGRPFLVGEFQVRIGFPETPTTQVSYVIPVDGEGRPLPAASNMVFYAPFNGEDGSTFLANRGWLGAFWFENNCTVFSMFVKINPQGFRHSYGNYLGGEWFEVVCAVQDHLCTEFEIEKRPFFVVGESAGGNLAGQMATAMPERIAAAAWCGATNLAKPAKPNRSKLLALNTWGCPGMIPTLEAVRWQREVGGEVWHGITPPHFRELRNYHAPGEIAYLLIQQFIIDAMRSREMGVEFPSPEFLMLWQTLPQTVTDGWLQPKGGVSDELLVYPPLPDANRVILLAGGMDHIGFGSRMDGLLRLAEAGAIPISLPVDEHYLEHPEQMELQLKQVLERPEWAALPIYVAGSGMAGQLAALAVLRQPDQRIKRIITLDAEFDSPFPHLSLAAAWKNDLIPLHMMFSHNWPDLPEGITSTVFAMDEKYDGDDIWNAFIAEVAREETSSDK
ncbi:alpha/beta hydrolase fold domain-containing protein [Victivallis sp. Marseille-Q1083]|uniref:alpha/beta hydrolase n=1 Tax=Victivallis sp. Marseille-Q1083 TaxID=2717288 RepID=UPI001588F87D|nr:alpha/beta hydrolase fold domain-containing protein [Victivallis sp. Marseille-Q1083]